MHKHRVCLPSTASWGESVAKEHVKASYQRGQRPHMPRFRTKTYANRKLHGKKHFWSK